AFAGQHLAARLLDVAAEPLRLASRFLGQRTAGLGLGSCALRLGPARLRLRRWLLGLLYPPSRRAVCAGVFPWGHVYSPRFLLLACDGDRPGRFRQPSLRAAAIPALLLWRLLRRQLPSRWVLSVVFLQLLPLRLRSHFRPRAMAASPGRPMGSPRSSRLPEPPRSRRCPTAAD